MSVKFDELIKEHFRSMEIPQDAADRIWSKICQARPESPSIMFDAHKLQRVADSSEAFEAQHGSLTVLGEEPKKMNRWLKACVWILAISGSLTLCGQIANATPHEALVRVWVSEAGWDSPADHAGISAVLYRRAHRYGRRHRHPLIVAAEAFSKKTQPSYKGERSWRLGWVSSLTEQCEPTYGSGWSPYRRLCVELHDRALAWMSGSSWECRASGPLDNWGGPDDVPAPSLVPIAAACREPWGPWLTPLNTFYCDTSKSLCPNSCEPMDEWETFTNPWETARS